MNADDRRFSLGWSPAGNVAPRPTMRAGDDGEGIRPETEAEATARVDDQDELDLWWAMVSADRGPKQGKRA